MCKKYFYKSEIFGLSYHQRKTSTKFYMELFVPVVNTTHLPKTLKFLKKSFPEVLNTQCFNEHNFSFKKEVTRTEIGHLLEHILLEELCRLKIQSGEKSASFSGKTSWNWLKEKEGVFHITIDIGEKESHLLNEALNKGINLVENLFLEHRIYGQANLLSVESA